MLLFDPCGISLVEYTLLDTTTLDGEIDGAAEIVMLAAE